MLSEVRCDISILSSFAVVGSMELVKFCDCSWFPSVWLCPVFRSTVRGNVEDAMMDSWVDGWIQTITAFSTLAITAQQNTRHSHTDGNELQSQNSMNSMLSATVKLL
jgi:hypothetical protein